MPNIKDKRVAYKPFEYPEVLPFIKAMEADPWTVDRLTFDADKQNFLVDLTDLERSVLKKSLLSIAQVEVGVKLFWGNLYTMFPKPEMNGLGSTFASCEWRHSQAYSELIDVLGLSYEFSNITKVPIFKERLELIEQYLGTDNDTAKILFFTIVIENASLFSQFANILAMKRFKGKMKNIANIIEWTSTDERLHAKAGIFLINKLREEGHVTLEELDGLVQSIKEYMKLEEKLIDWIFEDGEFDFYTKENLLNFMKRRIDDSIEEIGLKPIYNISDEDYQPMAWYDEEVNSEVLADFISEVPVDYTENDIPITHNDLF